MKLEHLMVRIEQVQILVSDAALDFLWFHPFTPSMVGESFSTIVTFFYYCHMDSSSIRTKFWNYFELNLSFNSANLSIRSPVFFVIWNSVELMDGYRTISFCPYPHTSTERS